MNERALNAGMLAGSLALAIATGEVAIRKYGRVQMQPTQQTTDSLVIYRLKPNVKARAVQPGVLTYQWTTNSQQLRATREYALRKPPRTKRVVAIGDSFTFGIGVNNDETYSAQVERLLQTECTDSVEVLNFGVGGYGLSQEVEVYERYARPFAPDVVVYGFMTNDLADNLIAPIHLLVGDSAVPKPVDERPQMLTAKRISEMIPGYGWLITHSALVNGARQAYFVLKRRREAGGVDRAAQDEAWYRKQQNADSSVWKLQRALLRRMRDDVESRGARFLVLIMSEQRAAGFYYAGHPERAGVQYGMRQVCADLALRCIDVGAWLVSNAPGADLDTLYIQGDGHYSAAGQRLVAQALEPALRELLGCPVMEAVSTRWVPTTLRNRQSRSPAADSLVAPRLPI